MSLPLFPDESQKKAIYRLIMTIRREECSIINNGSFVKSSTQSNRRKTHRKKIYYMYIPIGWNKYFNIKT